MRRDIEVGLIDNRPDDMDIVTMTPTLIKPAETSGCTEISGMLERLKDLKWEGGSDFPIPPQGVIEFSKLSRESNVSVRKLSAIVESEPGMTAEVLKSVNSSLYGIREKVEAVPKAIALLGVSTCASIFLTKALNRAMKFLESQLFAYADVRRESLERARFAREIAVRMGIDPILSHTAATLQDILLPFLTRRYQEEYAKYLQQLDCSGIEEFERDTFGWTHAEVTAKTLMEWGFPESLVLRVLLHHAPPEELFLSHGVEHQATPNATAALLSDVMHQSPGGVARLVELQRYHPKMKLLSIASSVDKETYCKGGGECGGISLVNRIQCEMMEQVERQRSDSIVPGRQFGNYVLEKKLTESSMGAIFRARHIMLRRQTAVKFLRADRITRDSIRQFEREVQLTSTLAHPNTISIFDFGRTSDDLFYYAMEYIDGPTLSDLIGREGALPAVRVISFLKQIFGSLAEAHGHGLVHRDIKPQNIMLSEGIGGADRITVLDFGLVTEAASSERQSIKGTPSYMSPEAALCCGSIDERSDLYSVAAVAYFLLTGKPIFDGTMPEVLNHHVYTEPQRPSERTSNPIPQTLEELLMECLRKSPAERPPSANAVLERLSFCETETQWTLDQSEGWWADYRQNPAARTASSTPELDDTIIGPV